MKEESAKIEIRGFVIYFKSNEVHIHSIEHNGTKILIDEAAKQFREKFYSFRSMAKIKVLCKHYWKGC